MNSYLLEEFQKLGADEVTAVISSHVYLEICEVKKYWEPEYVFNPEIRKIIIKARRKPEEEPCFFIPVTSYEELSFAIIQGFLKSCQSTSIFLAIVHPDSTCVYYKIYDGLEEPEETTAKHLRVDKHELLDAKLRKHRKLIEQAALCGRPITLPKEGGNGAKSSWLNKPGSDSVS